MKEYRKGEFWRMKNKYKVNKKNLFALLFDGSGL